MPSEIRPNKDLKEYFFPLGRNCNDHPNDRKPEKCLNCPACVTLDNRIALDQIFPEQGGICSIANTSYYTWIKHF